MNPSAAIAAGRFLVVGCATKNIQTTDGASNNHSTVEDSKGHVWTKHEERTETAGVAGDGTTVSIWSTRVTTQLETTDTITLTTSGNIAEKIITATEVQCAAGMQIALAQVGLGPNAVSAAVSGLASLEYFLIGVFGAEGSDNAKTADGDYAEQHDLRSRNNAAATTIHVQTRIATLTADTCTSSAWTNTDPYALLAAFYETPLVPVPVGAAALEGQAPSRVMNHIASVGVCALALVGASMGVAFQGAETGALTFEGQAPTISVAGGSNTDIAVPVGALALAGQAPSIGTTVSVPAGALALAGQAPALRFEIPIPAGSLSLAGQAPTVSEAGGSGTTIAVPAGALTLSGTNVAVAFTGAETGALTFAGAAPTLSISASVTIQVPIGALTLAGTNVSIAFIDPPAGTLVLNGLAPTISIGGGTGIGVPVGALLLAGQAPTLRTDFVIATPAGALTFSGLAPTASIGIGRAMPVGALTLDGQAPTIPQDIGRAVPAGALVLAGQAPTVSLDIGRAVPAGSLTLTGAAPALNGQLGITPDAGALALGGVAPNVKLDLVIAVGAGALSLAGQTPTAGVVGTFNPSWAANANQLVSYLGESE